MPRRWQEVKEPESDPDRETERSVETFLTYRFARVQARLNDQATRILQDHAGISLSQWRVLSLIGDRAGTSSSEIVARSGIDKGLVSRTLKTLNEAGLVRSETSQIDMRVQQHDLTPDGRALFDRTLPHMAQRQQMIQSAFRPEELEAFLAALDRLEWLAEIEAFDP